jgi:hypothetical protein
MITFSCLIHITLSMALNRTEMQAKSSSESLKGRDDLEYIGVDGRMLNKSKSNKLTWINLAQNRSHCWAFVITAGSVNVGESFELIRDIGFSTRALVFGVGWLVIQLVY